MTPMNCSGKTVVSLFDYTGIRRQIRAHQVWKPLWGWCIINMNNISGEIKVEANYKPLDILTVRPAVKSSANQSEHVISRKGLEKVVSFLNHILEEEKDEFVIQTLHEDGVNPIRSLYVVFVKVVDD